MSASRESTNLSALKLALLAGKLRENDEERKLLEAEPIAIVGMACRLPGGVNEPDGLWDLLAAGGDAITEVPADRWDAAAYYDPDPSAPGKINTRCGGFLQGVREFDPVFFGIAPKEAVYMDPQHRLLLEVAWDAFDDAGSPLSALRGSRTGVFFALYSGDYGRMQLAEPAALSAHTVSGTVPSMAAGRLSYLFDLRGPSLVIDTACSSSLVAVHEAVQSLQRRESDLAVAGGSNLILTPNETISLAKWGMLAPDGRCKTFDESANGFVRSEGCGLVVLKRLADALRDGDRVRAVVRGTAVNQDGRSNVLTAPNGEAQRAVVRAALRRARIRPEDIGYVETHGTGTKVGDPIEVEALADVLGRPRESGAVCHLGAIKANIGHLEAAAGVAGLIKTVLCLERKMIPPQVHFRRLNPLLSLDGTALRIPVALTPWPASDVPRAAGVSSFGFSGTNAHIVVEEAPQLPARRERPARAQLLPLSAKTEQAVAASAQTYGAWLARPGAPALRDVCFTAAARREHHPYRSAVVARDPEEMREALRSVVPADSRRAAPRVAFLYSGQGSGAPGMAAGLLRDEPLFAETIARCDEHLERLAGWSVARTLADAEDTAWLADTERYQVVLFAVQVGLTELWRQWGVVPAAVAGHSIGEIAAAHVAGALDFAAALELVAHRARLMKQLAGPGAMGVVGLGAEPTERWLERWGGKLVIAADNGPESVTVAGEPAALERFLEEAALEGRFTRRLPVDRAFHSPAMDGAAKALAETMRTLAPRPGSLAIYSTVTGRRIDGASLDAEYWRRNVRDRVRFLDAARALLADGYDWFVEIGPHPAVLAGVEAAADGRAIVSVPSLRRGRDDRTVMLEGLARFYEAGVAIDWRRVADSDARPVGLPAYPWQRDSYWFDAGAAARRRDAEPARSAGPLLGRRVDSPFLEGALFENVLADDSPSWLRDHRLAETSIVPAAALIDMALCAAVAVLGAAQGIELRDGVIQRALLLPQGEPRSVQVRVEPAGGGEGEWRVRIASRAVEPAGPWETHFECRLLRGLAQGAAAAEAAEAAARGAREARDAKETREGQGTRGTQGTQGAQGVQGVQGAQAVAGSRLDGDELDVDALVARMGRRGIHFGPAFRALRTLRRSGSEASAVLAPPAAGPVSGHLLFPPRFDACLQSFEPFFADSPDAWLPVGFARVALARVPGAIESSRLRIVASPAGQEEMRADLTLHDGVGSCVEVEGFRIRAVPSAALERLAAKPASAFVHTIEWEESPAVGSAAVASAAVESEAAPLGGPWLVFADRGGVAEGFSAALAKRGEQCVIVAPGTEYERRGPGRRVIDGADPQHFERVLREREPGWPAFRRIAFLWGLDARADAEPLDAQPAVTGHALRLLKALGTSEAAEVWLVTRGAQRFPDRAGCAQAPLWGLGAVVPHEHATPRCRLVDLDPGDSPAEQVEALAAEALAAADAEDRIAWSGGRRFVARLRPAEAEPRRALESWLVRARPSGLIQDLALESAPAPTPGPGEVVVETRAIGVNFRDVLNALGMLGADAPVLGGECSGRVVAVGAETDPSLLGKDVMAFAIGAFRSRIALPASLVAPIPDGMGYAEAAALPVAFLTAIYGLDTLAGLKRGERILIHAATGGVGLAAVQVARARGATIYATAGSEQKRAYLRSLGVEHVFSSRDLAFKDAVLEATQGRGVDVVLNSLADEFVGASVAALADGGRFVELGKRGVWTAEQMARARPDVTFLPFDLSLVAARSPDVIAALFDDLLSALREGVYSPIPLRSYALDALPEALEHMARARHIGKIVLRVPAPPAETLRADASYLVTGATGGLASALAASLAERGARHLALLARRPPSERALRAAEQLRDRGVEVRWIEADVADAASLDRAIASIEAGMPPLRGVFHLAGVIDDAPIAASSWERFTAVMAPKVRGAWNLHERTSRARLDLFVLYSSIAAVLGWPGQGAYASGSAFLDGLARWRESLGLAALSIDWGPWADEGMAAKTIAEKGVDFERGGLRPFPASLACGYLPRLLESSAPQLVAGWLDMTKLPLGSLTASAEGARRDARAAAQTDDAGRLRAELEAAPADKRRGLLKRAIESAAAAALGLKQGYRFDGARPLNELGLDSLLAVQLANALGAMLGRPLGPTLLFDYPSIQALTDHLLAAAVPAASAPSAEATASGADRLSDVSDADAEAMLLEELESLKQTHGRP